MQHNPYESPQAPLDRAPSPQATSIPPLLAYLIVIAFAAIALAIRCLTLP